MRQVTRKGLITVAAAGGVLATFSGGTAFADSAVQGSAGNSPGAVSGNNIQAPVSVPINVCGNTVSVIGALNPASGTRCGDNGSTRVSGRTGNSSGIGSGNNIQAPIDVPVNVCGNGVSAISAISTASADCAGDAETTPPGDDNPDNPDNPGDDGPGNPGDDDGPGNPGGDSGGSDDVDQTSDVRTQSEPTGELAHTGAGEMVGIGVPLSAGLLVGGFVLYRRAARLAQR